MAEIHQSLKIKTTESLKIFNSVNDVRVTGKYRIVSKKQKLSQSNQMNQLVSFASLQIVSQTLKDLNSPKM